MAVMTICLRMRILWSWRKISSMLLPCKYSCTHHLEESLPFFMRELIDLEALMLCSDEDLQSMQMQAGPRKKVLNAIKGRKQMLQQPGRLVDYQPLLECWVNRMSQQQWGWCCGSLGALQTTLALYKVPDLWEWYLGFWRCLLKKRSKLYSEKFSIRIQIKHWWETQGDPGIKKWYSLLSIFLIFLNIERVKWMTKKGKILLTFPILDLKLYLSSHWRLLSDSRGLEILISSYVLCSMFCWWRGKVIQWPETWCPT